MKKSQTAPGLKILIGAWAIVISGLLMLGMARHAAPFVEPPELQTTVKMLVSGWSLAPQKRLIATHILDPRCSCSEKVLTYLKDHSTPEVENVIVLLSPAKPELLVELHNAGLKVIQSSLAEAKAEMKIQSVPWLIVLSRNLNIVYAGGYAESQIRWESDLRITEILAQAKAGKTPAALPSYGCVTSQKFRQFLMM